jgi:hypothetical protein
VGWILMWIDRAATLRAAEAIVSWMRDWEKVMQERHLQDHSCAVEFVGRSLVGPVMSFGGEAWDGKFRLAGTTTDDVHIFRAVIVTFCPISSFGLNIRRCVSCILS